MEHSRVLLQKSIVTQLVTKFPSLWNRKVHYRAHKSQTLVHLLSKMHPVHKFPSYFPKTHSDIIFRLNLGFLAVYRFSNQKFISISYLYHAYYMPH
jgi:hypothetical protein